MFSGSRRHIGSERLHNTGSQPAAPGRLTLEESHMEKPTNRPVHEIRYEGVRATLWLKETANDGVRTRTPRGVNGSACGGAAFWATSLSALVAVEQGPCRPTTRRHGPCRFHRRPAHFESCRIQAETAFDGYSGFGFFLREPGFFSSAQVNEKNPGPLRKKAL